MPNAMRTPETHPDDDVVGHRFRNLADGRDYLCDSFEEGVGYWMAPIAAADGAFAGKLPERHAVQPRAVGVTYHEIRPAARELSVPERGHHKGTPGRGLDGEETDIVRLAMLASSARVRGIEEDDGSGAPAWPGPG